jgi:hypothetical protein
MTIWDEILKERADQNTKWGGPEQDDKLQGPDWVTFIVPSLGQATKAFWRLDANLADFRAAMVTVAALAVAGIEWVDRKGKTPAHGERV